MRTWTTAVFLAFIFCVFSAYGSDLAEESNQAESANSSLMSGTKKMFGKVKNFFGFEDSGKAGRTSGKKQNASSLRLSGKKLNYDNSFRDAFWDKKIKEWNSRHRAVSKSLECTTFKRHKHSSSRSYRSSRRSFRSSHHRTRHSSRGRSHRRSRR